MDNIQNYLAVMTVLVGVIGIIFIWLQFRLAKKKRKDDLFNLRYEFYRNFSNIWISTNSKENPRLDITDLIPISEKAGFLFGKGISEHILKLENKRASHDMFPDEDFIEPFRKYLTLR